VKQNTQSVAELAEGTPEINSSGSEYLDVDGSQPQHRAIERLRLLWEQRKVLLRVMTWGLAASIVTALLIPNRYESVTRLMPPEPRSASGMALVAALASKGAISAGLPASLGSMASEAMGGKSPGALFVDMVTSRTVQDRLVDHFDLRKVYHDRYWEDARRDLTKHTSAMEDRKSGIITISVTDRDPSRAQKLAQAYVTELDRLVSEVSTSSARRERIFVEGRLKDVKHDLDVAAQQFSEFASKNTLVELNSQTKATVEAAAELQGSLIAAESELRGVEQIYTENNVRVRSLRARVAELRSQLEKMGGASSDANADNGHSDQMYPSIRKLPVLGVRWLDLYRETKIQEAVYEFLTQEYETAKIEEAKEIPTVKVLDLANMPETKSSPPRLLLVIAGTLFTFAIGIGWIFGVATWDQLHPEDPRRALAQEVFATVQARIPAISSNGSGLHLHWRKRNGASPSKVPADDTEI
jgi:capsule polysaccharide export protein KpsE/RkpR